MRAMSGRRWLVLLLALAVVAIALAMASNRVRGAAYYLSKSAFAAIEGETPEPVFEVARIEGEGNSRLYLFHGLTTDETQWDASQFDDLKKLPFTRVYVRLVVDNPAYFNDGGERYCRAFFNWMRDTQARLDRERPADRTYVAGISYGGFHSLLAAGELEFVDGFVAFIPLIDVRRVDLMRLQSNEDCSPRDFVELPPGKIWYVDEDPIVGSEDVEEILATKDIASVRDAQRDHSVSAPQAESAAAFLANLDAARGGR